MMRTLLTAALLLGLTAGVAFGQPGNDACINATALGEVTEYCSSPAQFTTAGATTSPLPKATCHFDTVGRDVWFSFIATASDVSIRVIGELPRASGGTLQFPEFALYDASCTMPTELACASDAFNTNVVETFAGDLVAGQLYFLRVQAREANVGTFQLCIESFDFLPEPQSDCVDGVILCDKSSFTVNNLIGAGDDTNEIESGNCIQEEFSSVWYRWTCDEAGSLSFTLTPNNPVDDLDFAVYELPGGIDDCAGKRVLRCMASGENISAPLSDWERCSGQTGLRAGDPDREEQPGCQSGDNNFAQDFQMESGRAYALVVNNFTDTGNGFGIVWGGTGTFVGPRPSFEIDPESGSQCDADEITFTNTSSLTPGSTGSYEWFFGSYASTPQAAGPGPHQITYGGFGDKTVSLRVTSSEGCVVTDTREVFIGPCCELSEPLEAGEPSGTNPVCPGTATGAFEVGIVSGEPDFFFSVDGGPFLSDRSYAGLFEGDYTVYVQNIKGCLDTVEVTLTDPPPIIVEVGDDRDIEFGDIVDIDAQVNAAGDFSYVWAGADSIVCLDADCSSVEVLTGQGTQVEVVATNEAGCVTSDLLRIEVRKTRPLFAPNAVSPNSDGSNDGWTLFGPENVIVGIETVRVFDRWGNMVFEASDLPINRPDLGWQGTFRGRALDPGVFAFYAEVRYIDDVVIPVTGDINLLR